MQDVVLHRTRTSVGGWYKRVFGRNISLYILHFIPPPLRAFIPISITVLVLGPGSLDPWTGSPRPALIVIVILIVIVMLPSLRITPSRFKLRLSSIICRLSSVVICIPGQNRSEINIYIYINGAGARIALSVFVTVVDD